MNEQWIPISERVPCRDDGFVMVVVNFNEPGLPRAIRLAWREEDDGLWRTQYGRMRNHWEITHWMPTPELPDEQ